MTLTFKFKMKISYVKIMLNELMASNIEKIMVEVVYARSWGVHSKTLLLQRLGYCIKRFNSIKWLKSTKKGFVVGNTCVNDCDIDSLKFSV